MGSAGVMGWAQRLSHLADGVDGGGYGGDADGGPTRVRRGSCRPVQLAAPWCGWEAFMLLPWWPAGSG